VLIEVLIVVLIVVLIEVLIEDKQKSPLGDLGAEGAGFINLVA